MNPPTVEILSQGEEILTGQVVDTNAAWLSDKLIALGFRVSRHTTVGDRLEDLVNVFIEINQRADVCICTGGLGPTSDDLTAEAVAKAFDCQLKEDKIAFQQIRQYFASRQKPMPEVNRKQAMLPEGSIRLDNHWGTAPGFLLTTNQFKLFCVPGVPYEMRQLFINRIAPLLEKTFNQRPYQLVTLRTVSLGESDIQQKVQQIKIPQSVTLSYRADLWENQLKLLFPPDYPKLEMIKLVNQYMAALDGFVISVNGVGTTGGSLVDEVGRLLVQRKATLSILETISAGKIATRCAKLWLDQGIIVNKVELLSQLFGVTSDQLQTVALLKDAAFQIAEQLCKTNNSDFALVQLWVIEDRLDQFDCDPVQIVTVAVDRHKMSTSTRDKLYGPSSRRQTRAAVAALNLLHRFLLKNGKQACH